MPAERRGAWPPLNRKQLLCARHGIPATGTVNLDLASRSKLSAVIIGFLLFINAGGATLVENTRGANQRPTLDRAILMCLARHLPDQEVAETLGR